MKTQPILQRNSLRSQFSLFLKLGVDHLATEERGEGPHARDVGVGEFVTPPEALRFGHRFADLRRHRGKLAGQYRQMIADASVERSRHRLRGLESAFPRKSVGMQRLASPLEQQILEDHHADVRIIELVGAHSFATIDYVSRRLVEEPSPLLVIDFRRVASITNAGSLLLSDVLRGLTAGGAAVVLTGIESGSPVWTIA